jgi:heme oxygenase
MPASSAGSLRSLLKSATADLHDMVDREFGRFDLNEEDGYRRFIVAHWIAMQAAQAQLAAFARNHLSIEAPDFVAMIAQDMDAAGITGIEGPGLSFDPVKAQDRGSGAGLCYVVCGSRLGIASIAKAFLQSGTGSSLASQSRYLTDRQGLGLWRQFLDWDNNTEFSPDEVEAARQTAVESFEIFRQGALKAASAKIQLNPYNQEAEA